MTTDKLANFISWMLKNVRVSKSKQSFNFMFKFKFASKIAFIAALAAIIVSCSEDSSSVDNQSGNASVSKVSKSILDDQAFLDFVTDEYNFFTNIKDRAAIDSAIADDKITDAEGAYMPIAFGFADNNAFEAYRTKQISRLAYLDQTYSLNSLSDSEKQDLYLDGLVKVNLPPVIVVPDPGDPEYTTLSCNSQFNWCMGAAMSTALVGHSACLMADATTAGLAAWVCHGLVVAAQGVAEGYCLKSYEDCKNKN